MRGAADTDAVPKPREGMRGSWPSVGRIAAIRSAQDRPRTVAPPKVVKGKVMRDEKILGSPRSLLRADAECRCRVPVPSAECRVPVPAPSAKCSSASAKCRVPSAECRVPSAECRVPSAECRVPSAECRVPSAECRVPSAECRLATPGWRSAGDGAPPARPTVPVFDSQAIRSSKGAPDPLPAGRALSAHAPGEATPPSPTRRERGPSPRGPRASRPSATGRPRTRRSSAGCPRGTGSSPRSPAPGA